ncbi:hypothetical protein DNK34_03295 [Pseudomonas dryadis]|uniref:Uncharacterized protein n=1 Tax=Phytopseudomonas dryadis TaxID=2487520 RepID=A0ABY1ZAP7_9GAMM|nr:hypothetical protein DNK34_03295 [Pseudomonas dryadis]TBV15153.1 hypothetical protein DNK41_18855 [Pseudomonas sp. FRB 230]
MVVSTRFAGVHLSMDEALCGLSEVFQASGKREWPEQTPALFYPSAFAREAGAEDGRCAKPIKNGRELF